MIEDNTVYLLWGNLRPVAELDIDKYGDLKSVSAPAEVTDSIAEVVDYVDD